MTTYFSPIQPFAQPPLAYTSLATSHWAQDLLSSSQWKGVLIGHSDNNAAEDTGKLHITLTGNYWKNVNSRTPSFRFGTGHIFK